jgi:ADP-L-glycero-D-manno-heptose 6-epimerase
MIILTGGAGFIGSAFLWKLNTHGITDVMVVDENKAPGREENLANLQFAEYLDKSAFIDFVRKDKLSEDISSIIHMGACSSTTEGDADYLRRNNFEYTRDLALYALNKAIPFLYASSAATYGDGSFGYSDLDENTKRLNPLNLYGKSKQDFDLYALSHNLLDRITGFKFFNVYGPNEYHKADMKSVIAKAYDVVAKEGVIRLFKSYKREYGDGEQKRDFVYIKDAVNVMFYFLENPDKTGLFNVGTGKAQSWNDLARGLFSAMDIPLNIEYIEMPAAIRDKYQYFTQADLTKLRSAGYTAPFNLLAQGIEDYCSYLKAKQCL